MLLQEKHLEHKQRRTVIAAQVPGGQQIRLLSQYVLVLGQCARHDGLLVLLHFAFKMLVPSLLCP